MDKRQFLGTSLVALALPATTWAADAPYPTHPLHFTVLNPPGGASDIMGRLMGQRVGETLGQPVLIENRPGKSVGMLYIKNAAPDGYNFVLGGFSPTVVPQYLSKISYDMERDYKPVSMVATAPVVVVVKADAPYSDVKGFIAAIKAKGNGYNFGTGGTGTIAHLLGEVINDSAHVEMQHIPYKGSIQAVNDVLAGQIDMVPGDPSVVVPHIRSGKLKAIAVTSPKRFSQLPEVPTFAESGMPDVVGLNPYAVYLPAGVPQPVFDKFRAALVGAMTNPELVAKFKELGVDAVSSTPEEVRDFLRTNGAKYGKLIKERNITE